METPKATWIAGSPTRGVTGIYKLGVPVCSDAKMGEAHSKGPATRLSEAWKFNVEEASCSHGYNLGN